jgi:hypothetical protein
MQKGKKVPENREFIENIFMMHLVTGKTKNKVVS